MAKNALMSRNVSYASLWIAPLHYVPGTTESEMLPLRNGIYEKK
jgi:hypothetical protein